MVRVLEAADLDRRTAASWSRSSRRPAPASRRCCTSAACSSGRRRARSRSPASPTSKLSERGRTLLRRNTVGYVYQFHHLLPEFTALENVAMPQLIAGSRPEGGRQARAWSCSTCSASAPRATTGRPNSPAASSSASPSPAPPPTIPRVILADEPTGNLDPATSDLVFEALAALIRERGRRRADRDPQPRPGAACRPHRHDPQRPDRPLTL